MLTRLAQPTNRPRRRPRFTGAAASRFSAARGARPALIAILISLAMPAVAPATGAAAAAGGGGAWPWPLVGEVITPYRNGTDRYAAGQHRGLDIAAPIGMQVRAIVDGRVSFSGKLPDGGQTVTVRSADGAYLVSSLHLSARSVARGDAVSAGTVIGAVGVSGKRSAEQPHLHLSVRRASDRAYIDPMTLLGPQRVAEVPAASAPPAAEQPAAARPAAARPHVTALEQDSAARSNVHAQSTGDSSPATRQGAVARSTATGRSAGASAREGHAARHTGRVAPPPLAVPRTAVKTPAALPAATPRTAPAERRAQPASAPNRYLLLAVAFVCMIALAMRRKPRPAPSRGVPPGADAEAATAEAEVIPFHRAS